jgi:hypothetical protein
MPQPSPQFMKFLSGVYPRNKSPRNLLCLNSVTAPRLKYSEPVIGSPPTEELLKTGVFQINGGFDRLNPSME